MPRPQGAAGRGRRIEHWNDAFRRKLRADKDSELLTADVFTFNPNAASGKVAAAPANTLENNADSERIPERLREQNDQSHP